MNIYKYLVLIKGQDKTEQIKHIEYKGGLCIVTFNNGTYNYSRSDLVWMNAEKQIDCKGKIIYARGVNLNDVSNVIDFGSLYKIIYNNRYSELYKKREIVFMENALSSDFKKDIFSYFKSVAQEISIIVNGNCNILGKQYSDIQFISNESVLASFLSSEPSVKTFKLPQTVIYPFGLNKSQKTAVENALTSQISIIQGPPGTGKTQTILNILANIVLANKTVAVVSNNNSAIENVIHKLEKNDLGFITALLGNHLNKTNFLNSQSGKYPEMTDWNLEKEERNSVSEQINSLTSELNKQMEIKEKCAILEQQVRELETEQHYFEEYYQNLTVEKFKVKSVNSHKLLRLWNEFEDNARGKIKAGLFNKIVVCCTYGFGAIKLFKMNPKDAISNIQSQYYETKLGELYGEVNDLKEKSEKYNFKEKFNSLTDFSMTYFKDKIAEKYADKDERRIFSKWYFNNNSFELVKEYPVILSTTYSIKNCLENNFIYDYIIVDESSQVDLVTGVLAMSCAKNIVIVGDTKQLPNVITSEDVKISNKYWMSGMNERFDFATESLLSSAILTWKDAKSVLLREHYRCKSDIINFCNQKFYDNQLIIMTNNNDENDDSPALKLYKTSPGNHGRNHINQREIDVIKNEVLPEYISKGEQDIGIITPYRDQVTAMKKQLPEFCEIDTVHKFQGREKNVIILSSVLNDIDKFVNDPNMINVAVSRAVKSLAVVTSGNKSNDKTYYGELARYIEYNNYSVVDTKTYSVFDMLYKEYYQERKKYLAKHKRISEWDSENLMYGVIEDVLENFKDFDCACHVQLSMVIKDMLELNEREKQYIQNPLTHIDFLLFKKIDKSPILAIEVDGVKYHQEGSKQSERDKIKNHVMEAAGISLIRLRTDGSNEKHILEQALNDIMKGTSPSHIVE